MIPNLSKSCLFPTPEETMSQGNGEYCDGTYRRAPKPEETGKYLQTQCSQITAK